MATHVMAFFDDLAAADRAYDALAATGIEADRISLAFTSTGDDGTYFAIEQSSKAPEGAAIGAAAGGGLAAAVTGLAVIGSLNPLGLTLWAGGPLSTILASAGLGGAVGTALGALFGTNIPEHEVKALSGRVESGNILLGVLAPDARTVEVEALLDEVGGTGIRRLWHSK